MTLLWRERPPTLIDIAVERDAGKPFGDLGSGFGLEITEGVVAGDVERHAFDPRLFARLIVENLFAITAPVAPAQIHAQENLRPVLGLGAAGAGMERDDGVTPVVRPAEQLGQLGLRHLLGNGGDFAARFVQRFFAFFILGDVEKKTRLCQVGVMFFPAVENVFEGGLFFENALGFFSVVPKIGLRGELAQLGDALLLGVNVKAASAKAQAALRGG